MFNYLKISDIQNYILTRKENSHKTNYGSVMIIGSSKRYMGAGIISARSAISSGSGIVTLATKEDAFNYVAPSILSVQSEVIPLNIDEFHLDFLKNLKNCNSVLIGPGLGKNKFTLETTLLGLENVNSPLILDADSLNIISENRKILEKMEKKEFENLNKNQIIVITPHEMEFSRLSNIDINEINGNNIIEKNKNLDINSLNEKILKNKINISKNFAKKYNLILLLKGHNTIITDGKYVNVLNIGTPKMATGGMGDCLSGIILSFLGFANAQKKYSKKDILNYTCLSAFIHSYAAKKLSKNKNSVLASDIVNNLQTTIWEIKNYKH